MIPVHCPECGYRSHGEEDMGMPWVCDDCLPARSSVRWFDDVEEDWFRGDR